MNKSPKSIFVSVFIAVVLIGMSISAIPTNQNKELGDKEHKSFTHTNVSFE